MDPLMTGTHALEAFGLWPVCLLSPAGAAAGERSPVAVLLDTVATHAGPSPSGPCTWGPGACGALSRPQIHGAGPPGSLPFLAGAVPEEVISGWPCLPER